MHIHSSIKIAGAWNELPKRQRGTRRLFDSNSARGSFPLRVALTLYGPLPGRRSISETQKTWRQYVRKNTGIKVMKHSVTGVNKEGMRGVYKICHCKQSKWNNSLKMTKESQSWIIIPNRPRPQKQKWQDPRHESGSTRSGDKMFLTITDSSSCCVEA